MKKLVAAYLILTSTLLAQRGTGPATTKGPCSPAVTGSNNHFEIKSCGMTEEQEREFKSLIQRVIEQRNNLSEISSKMDSCLAGIAALKGGPTGNLKERTVSLASRIMTDLYEHGWKEGRPRHQPPPTISIHMPPPLAEHDAPRSEMTWTTHRSYDFQTFYLKEVQEIVQEFTRLSIRNRRLDDELEMLDERMKGNEQLGRFQQLTPHDRWPLLPMEIEDIADSLRELANQIP